jgi:hypothetical protein
MDRADINMFIAAVNQRRRASPARRLVCGTMGRAHMWGMVIH